MARLFHNDPRTPEGKYPIVLRRDGTVVTVRTFTLLAKDPLFATAIGAYADEAERRGMDPEWIADLRAMIPESLDLIAREGPGDPGAGPHRTDDPRILAWARSAGAKSA